MDAVWDVLDEVDSRLRDRAVELVEHLRGITPNASQSTRRTVRFGNRGGLAVDTVGPNKGRITDFNDGGNKAQSPFQFIQSEIGGDFAGALQWAKAWLGIEGERPEPRLRREDPKSASAEAEREEAERRAKVGQIVAEARDVRGTPAEAYLRGDRGITAELPDAVRWRPKAWDRYGSLVLLATDTAGAIKAVQQVYVTAEGAKAPVKVQKRTNGLQAGAAVRLPGTAPLTLIEGPETGLSTWQATGNETWIALGGIGKLVDQVPPGSEVVVGRDADPEGSKADKALIAAVEALVARGCRVRLACPPYDPVWRKPDQKKVDFNDVLKNEGEAAIRAIFAAAEVLGPPAPHYSAEPLPLDQAKTLLNEAVVDWVGHAVTHGDGVKARQVGVKGAAGTGKTTETRNVLEAFPATVGRHIDIFMPRHRLADEFALEAAGGPLRVKVIRGREKELTDGSTMCAKADEAGKVARAGFSVWESMCRRVDSETGNEEVCEHFATCPYVAQFDDPEPAVRIMAHESMFLPRNSGMPKPQAVIIDESFHAKAMLEANFALDRLTSGLWRSSGRKVSMDDQDRRNSIAERVRRALLAGEHPRDHGVTAEDCRFIAKLEIGAVEGIGITPGMSHAAQRKRLDGYQRTEALKLYRFWKILAAEIERGGPLRQIEFRPNWKRYRDDEPRDRIYLFWRRDLELPDVPVLVLDADLDPTIARKFLPRLEVVEVPVDRRAEVIQVRDTACSRRRLLAWEEAPETEVSRAANRLADVQALFDVEAAKGARVLLVTYKAAATRLKVPSGCAVDHFGNIRGTDDYKPYDTVIIAGREQPRVDAAEAIARALFADDPEPLTLTGELMEQVRGYRLRDGSSVAGKVSVHVDPRVQAVIEQVRERETAQAIDRLRLIHRTVPARVIVLSNLVLDLTVDRLTTWREIMPSRLEQAAARGPAVPLSASELRRCFPKLWLSKVAATRDLQRTVNVTKSHIETSLWEKVTFKSAHYRRVGQPGRASPALIRADAPDPRAALEAVVGPVDWFEMEQADEPAQAEAAPVNGGIQPFSQSQAAAQAPPAEVDPPVADPVEDLDQQLRIVAFGGRLADLSTRVDYARPPHRWGDFTDIRREQEWRARMSALHELPVAAGGRR
jgi:hypothetical protein